MATQRHGHNGGDHEATAAAAAVNDDDGNGDRRPQQRLLLLRQVVVVVVATATISNSEFNSWTPVQATQKTPQMLTETDTRALAWDAAKGLFGTTANHLGL